MGNIYIVTDSTADIPLKLRESLNIEMIPLTVHFGDEALLDAIDIHPDTFYERLTQEEMIPTTSQPSPGDFLQLYKRILQADRDAHIISLHLSSALSGTFQSATLAKNLLEADGDKLTLIDTLSASYGLGAMAITAAKAAQRGKTVDEIVQLAHQLRERMAIFFLVDTLEYLEKGGRIGKATAFVGSLLKIKPILTIDDEGEVSSVDKARGQLKAMNKINDWLTTKFATDEPVDLYILHASAENYAKRLEENVRAHFQVVGVEYRDIGAVIGTHTGPGTTAVIMVPSDGQAT